MSNSVWPPAPPINETEVQKVVRLEAEREAKKISDDIDRALDQERQELRKHKPATKVLLLGQAESGKSTMIKNFQMHFCPSAFKAEAEAWRAVIHLNLARFVNYLLQVLSTGASATGATARGTLGAGRDYRMLQMRLSPLKQVELILTRALSAEQALSSPVTGSPVGERSPWRADFQGPEISVRSGSGWKTLLRKRRGQAKATTTDELDDARRILDACKEDIATLWKACGAQIIEDTELDIHHHARYFLGEALRVADIRYIPTEDDILRARLRTFGVEEYRLTMESGRGNEWVFYDVGGARSQRFAWASYFDDVNAVIFLAPMSGFNERLEEDPKVNRLSDAFELWASVCKNTLLARATFILLLNKADLLHAKLKSGIQFEDYVSSYRGKPNRAEPVAEYLRDQMIRTHRECSPLKKRQLHAHIICAIDTRVMSKVVNSIRDVLLVNMLQDTTLL